MHLQIHKICMWVCNENATQYVYEVNKPDRASPPACIPIYPITELQEEEIGFWSSHNQFSSWRGGLKAPRSRSATRYQYVEEREEPNRRGGNRNETGEGGFGAQSVYLTVYYYLSVYACVCVTIFCLPVFPFPIGRFGRNMYMYKCMYIEALRICTCSRTLFLALHHVMSAPRDKSK